MKEEKRPNCPACRESGGKEIGEKNGFLMLACQTCGSLYSSHLPGSGESEDYDEYYTESNLKVPEFILGILDEIIGGFQPHFSNGRLLDIGFGAGTVLQVAEKKGWQVTGVEVSQPAIEHARKLGYEVFHGELHDARYPDDHFDVITASEIIEHCPQPEVLLREVARILRPGGLFWATTPSSKGLSYQLLGLEWSTICPPEHLQLFSRNGVSSMLTEAGFSSFKLHTYGFNPFEVYSAFRNRKNNDNSQNGTGFNRVGTGYSLNEKLTSNPFRKTIKQFLNGTLNLLKMGDSLKIRAIK